MAADLFGNLIPERAEPRVLTVTELTRTVRSVLEESVGMVWVEGEVSNYRKQPSGHQYFTLKDAQSQLTCVWFARPGFSWRKQIPLTDGMQVQARGALTVYEARGVYQLSVQLVQAGGAGLLQAKFEALKRKLAAEGLFEPERKHPLPKFPTTVAIVTSSAGAALRDMLNILSRRAPWVRVIVSPVRVQGDGAAEEIVAALAELNRAPANGLPAPDLVVLARGGGSTEDLWEFNDEMLARAIAASALPIVSAVGHEIDFTIADFVADLRAPTPSAAAELIVPDSSEMLRRIDQAAVQIRRCASAFLEREKKRVAYLARDALFAEPRRRLSEAAQRLDVAAESLTQSLRARCTAARQRVADSAAVLRQHRPDQLLALAHQRVRAARRQLDECARLRVARQHERLRRAADMLRLLSPQTVLDRGYTITTKADGTPVFSSHETAPGMELITRLRDGSVHSRVEEAESQ